MGTAMAASISEETSPGQASSTVASETPHLTRIPSGKFAGTVIAGIAVGSALGILLILACALWWTRKRRNKKRYPPALYHQPNGHAYSPETEKIAEGSNCDHDPFTCVGSVPRDVVLDNPQRSSTPNLPPTLVDRGMEISNESTLSAMSLPCATAVSEDAEDALEGSIIVKVHHDSGVRLPCGQVLDIPPAYNAD